MFCAQTSLGSAAIGNSYCAAIRAYISEEAECNHVTVFEDATTHSLLHRLEYEDYKGSFKR
jgi:hypothetical protein